MIKDHEIAEMNNRLREVAIQYDKSQQLRARLSAVVLPTINKLEAALLQLRYEKEMERYYKNAAEAELAILTKKIVQLESDIEQSGGKL